MQWLQEAGHKPNTLYIYLMARRLASEGQVAVSFLPLDLDSLLSKLRYHEMGSLLHLLNTKGLHLLNTKGLPAP